MDAYRSIKEIVEDLKLDYSKLPQHDLLNFAIKIQRNEILAVGLNVTKSDKYSPALEAIAIQLGFNPESPFQQTLIEAINPLKSKQCLMKQNESKTYALKKAILEGIESGTAHHFDADENLKMLKAKRGLNG